MSSRALTKKIRFGVFKRDSFVCQYCGDTPPKVVLEVDHINPVALGGDNSTDNLLTSCFDCNRGKGAEPLTTIPSTLKEKADRMAEAESQLAAYNALLRKKQRRLKSDALKIIDLYTPGHFNLPQRQYLNLTGFIEELGFFVVLDAMEISIRKVVRGDDEDKWRYFSGICWNKIKGR